MQQYVDIVKHVLNNGIIKAPVRKDIDGTWKPVDGGVRTIACPNVVFSHDMKNGFPLLTTKKVAWKSVRVELEGFIKGITSKSWYKERGCNIWNEWCNPERIEDNSISWDERKKLQLQEDDLGPIYGFQWRRFNQCYDANDSGWIAKKWNEGDQLQNIVHTLRQNPMDRRMVCSAWNPLQMNKMALPPCHWGWEVTVIGNDIHLFWAQRSCDLMLGVPFNIASYGLLLELLAYDSGFNAGNLSGMLVDCHIYENQIEAAKEQITRSPRDLPNIRFSNKSGNLKMQFDIFDWTHQDIETLNYNPHPKIDFGAVTV